jgi:hypothetical protein
VAYNDDDAQFNDDLAPGPKKDIAGFYYIEVIGLVAALMGMISAFLPWGKTEFGIVWNGIAMDGIVVLVASFCALVCILAWKDNETTRKTGVWVTFLAVVMLAFILWDLISFNSSVILSYGAGYYLAFLSSILLLLVGFVSLRGRKLETPQQ